MALALPVHLVVWPTSSFIQGRLGADEGAEARPKEFPQTRVLDSFSRYRSRCIVGRGSWDLIRAKTMRTALR